jgi:gliding motility-associated-like protein
MKKQILFIAAFALLNLQAFAQGTVTLGPDHILPACKNCDTIVATSTAPTTGAISYNVGAIAYTPYSYTTGTPVPGSTTDDVWATVVNIPFPFCFYGNVYNQLLPSTNGTLTFDVTQASTPIVWALSAVTPLPNATFADAFNSIMCPYQDLLPNPATPVRTETFGVAPNRVFVISWANTPMFSCTAILENQQIALYEGTNVIETYIGNKNSCAWNSNLAIHGTQNINGTVAHIVPGRNVSVWTATNDAWRWTPTSIAGPGSPAPVVYTWIDLSTGLPIGSNSDTLVVCPTQTTSYQVKATWNLCGTIDSQIDVITVVKQGPIVATATNIVDANCFGSADGTYYLNVSGGNGSPYTITQNGTSISNGQQSGLVAGVYTVVATDIYNCSTSIQVTINEPPLLVLSIASQTDVLCRYQNTGTVHLQASGGVPGYEYWYNNNEHQSSTNFDSMRAGVFTFNVKDAHGCITPLGITVLEPDSLLNVDQVAHEATCINKHDGFVEAIPHGGVPNYNYLWNTIPPQYGATATDLETGVYHVLVTDANGCITATQIQVEQQLCCQIFLPDAFTPNGDNVNDLYRPLYDGGGVFLGEYRVYNRWGQELYSTRELKSGWDGKFKGIPQNGDTYHYIVQYQCNEKGIISQKVAKGDFILIR